MKKLLLLFFMPILILAGCGSAATADQVSDNEFSDIQNVSDEPEISGIKFSAKEEFTYAETVDIYYSEDGYKLIDVHNSARYLIVPEGDVVPENLPEDVVVITKPVDNIYLAASSAMALIDKIGALGDIGFSGTEADEWYIKDATKAMDNGDILYAGKYSQPDFEMLIEGGCSLAVESTMILHKPEVKEKLESLGIPVFIDHSSYETHPLGRVEWIKVYGVLTDHKSEADEFFDSQKKMLDDLEGIENSGKTVAFFFINSNNQVVVRRSDDYIPKMIELAGGNYIFKDLESINPDSKSGSVTLSMEEFYATAKDADYLIYNATIEAPINSVDELLEKDALFKDFKAVIDGNVYTTDKYMYQATDIIGEFILDIHKMLEGETDMTFLTHVD